MLRSRDFYDDKRILITGVAGVKGTWLALALLEAGARVVGIDNQTPDTFSNFAASGLEDRIQFVLGDVTDLALMRKLIRDVDGIFHLAAIALVGEAELNPREAYRSNVLGTATLLEAIRLENKPLRIVLVTTDKVYAAKDDPWMESDPLGGTGVYATSKVCAELVIKDYQRRIRSKDILIGIARAGNVVVGGDLYFSRTTIGGGRLVPDCFDALIHGREPEIFNPSFTRPYTYGLDILSGYMILMSKLHEDGAAGEAFNFGPVETLGISNGVIATKLCALWGNGITWKAGIPRPEPFTNQSLSWQKARQRLGWRPVFTLDYTLKATTDWYRAWSGWQGAPGGLYKLNCELLKDAQKNQSA